MADPAPRIWCTRISSFGAYKPIKPQDGCKMTASSKLGSDVPLIDHFDDCDPPHTLPEPVSGSQPPASSVFINSPRGVVLQELQPRRPPPPPPAQQQRQQAQQENSGLTTLTAHLPNKCPPAPPVPAWRQAKLPLQQTQAHLYKRLS
ncbi:hypothetical protein D9Q98_008838 [Chlorella vulgaris]|uniref:Uncharacterized protein n=1 Tax=Chlorella vulgaris TaxID=3077 RepID=A0A9D4TIR0_CHLVU|nr:hypothetical protein D9Q98_008838 [Chlorella vulgaris]